MKNSDKYLHFDIMTRFEKGQPRRMGKERNLVCCIGRGCPGNCTWCGGGSEAIKHITGRTFVSLRPAKTVAEEFIQLKKEFDLQNYYICFDPFPERQEYLLEIFEKLGKELPNQIKLTFENFGLPTKTFLESVKMNLHPETIIIISPEFGSEKLRNQHKAFSFSNKELFEILDYMEEISIKSVIFFTNVPFETRNDFFETEKLVKEIKTKYKMVKETPIQPIKDFEPYSPWSVNPEKYNVEPNLKTLDDYYNFNKGYREFW